MYSVHTDQVPTLHARIKKILSEGVQYSADVVFFLFFVFFEEMDATKSGSSSARQRNAIKMAFSWRADNGPPLNAGLVAL